MSVDAAARHACEQYFAGDLAMFRSFRAGCIERFAAEIEAAEQALAAADLDALRHLAHSWKTVMRLIGHEELATGAEVLERCCTNGAAEACAAAWAQLRPGLARLIER